MWYPLNPKRIRCRLVCERCTNCNGANQHYADANVALDLGTAMNALFGSGSVFRPRVWNGTIYYRVIPAPASLALLGLGGLVAARRRR